VPRHLSADRKKLIERIAKLLALADGTSYDAEAQAARETALRMTAAHNRLFLGLCEEIAEKRRQLSDNLGKVHGFYNGRWREPQPQGLMLQHYLRIGFDKRIVP
jgi:hypothetical protein